MFKHCTQCGAILTEHGIEDFPGTGEIVTHAIVPHAETILYAIIAEYTAARKNKRNLDLGVINRLVKEAEIMFEESAESNE